MPIDLTVLLSSLFLSVLFVSIIVVPLEINQRKWSKSLNSESKKRN